jgi:DNA gyrase subunit A
MRPRPQEILHLATHEDRIVPINIDDEMRQSYLLYSMSVIVARALPDVRDGLKPVQRRILKAMDDLNLTPGSQPRKSAKICGDTSGNYHPHGEAVIYPSLVRMAQDFSSRYPMVQGQGNFGSIDGDPPAAMRYTEVRMSALAVEMLADIDKNTVNFQPSYDQRMQEPTVLPARYPNLLANGASGIAVGMATNIPPHNLGELCDATIMLIDNPDATIEELMQVIPAPDFPTAGLILGTKGAAAAFATGRGSVVMQAKTHIEPMDGGKHAIIITELPYQVNKQRLQEQIAELVKLKKIDGITALNDYTNKEGIRVVVELRRDVQPQKVLNYLLKHTPLRSTFGVLMLALVEGAPKILTLPQILQYYIKHRQEVIRRRTQFELEKAEARLHIVEGLRRALDVIDEIIKIIRASSNPTSAREALMSTFAFSQVQAQYILDMQLRALTGLEREKLEAEWRDLVQHIEMLRGILMDAAKVMSIIKDDLREIKKKYGDPRRTRIVPMEADQIGDEDMIPEEEMIVSITRAGYIKRVSAETYRVQKRGGRGVIGVTSREEDEIAHLFIATTHHHILFFTDRGRVYRVKAYEVPQTSRTAMGTAIINLIGIEPGDRVTATVPMASLDQEGYLVMATDRGEVKRTALSEFKNLRANGLNAFDLEPGDSLRWVHMTTGTDDVMMVTEQGQSIRFPETNLRSASRNSGGVRGISLEPNDRVMGVEIAHPDEDVLVVGLKGYGKRTPVAEYTRHHRGGKGVTTMKVTPKTGPVADFKMVAPGDRLLVSTSNGIVIRMLVDDIRRIGRATEGVRVIRLEEGDEVRTIERVQKPKEGGRKPRPNAGASEMFGGDGSSAQASLEAGDDDDLEEIIDETDETEEPEQGTEE